MNSQLPGTVRPVVVQGVTFGAPALYRPFTAPGTIQRTAQASWRLATQTSQTQADSRLHRTDECSPALAQVSRIRRLAPPAGAWPRRRARLRPTAGFIELMNVPGPCRCVPPSQSWRLLGPHFLTRAFGLWDELPTLRAWQAELDSRSPDFPLGTTDIEQVILYTDGSCLHPKNPQFRVASFAVLQALPDGQLGDVHSGPLPGSHQTPYRAELFAVIVAFSAHTKPLVFSDCLGVVRRCQKFIRAKQQGLSFALPVTNTDLWAMFLQQLEQVDISAVGVQWIPGRQDWRTCAGTARIHAWFSQWADEVAKAALQKHRASLFLTHVQAWEVRQPLVLSLARSALSRAGSCSVSL
eukprot:Skav221648  [mRNA]  locus=scaffold1174:276626:278282:- [translate_table: standard]